MIKMVEKKRNTLLLTDPYQKCLEELVDNGMYLDIQDAIRDALRDLFIKLDLDPFKNNIAKPTT